MGTLTGSSQFSQPDGPRARPQTLPSPRRLPVRGFFPYNSATDSLTEDPAWHQPPAGMEQTGQAAEEPWGLREVARPGPALRGSARSRLGQSSPAGREETGLFPPTPKMAAAAAADPRRPLSPPPEGGTRPPPAPPRLAAHSGQSRRGALSPGQWQRGPAADSGPAERAASAGTACPQANGGAGGAAGQRAGGERLP